MKHLSSLIFFTCGVSFASQAIEPADTIVKSLNGVEVSAIRASKSTPVAFTNVDRATLNAANIGKDMTYLLWSTPSVVTTSDAGTGIGYTSMRVRGTDATRINVTANGIPVNDAESHSLYWVNMPDLASSVQNIQVQRGVGTSTVGAGAFGASVNILTGASSNNPYAEFDASFGSYNTQKETVRIGTGRIGDHWNFDLRLSNVGSDGYIDRASATLRSFYGQASWTDENNLFKFIAFGGNERTYHAWNYASKKDMQTYGRRYNSCGYMFTDEDGVAHYYDDQTDHYTQFNYQLHFNHRFTSELNLNVAGHFTKGDGYYQEYKNKRSLIEYRLSDDPESVSSLVRRKSMDNSFGGAVFSLNYSSTALNAVVGGAINRYSGDHFGTVAWAKSVETPFPDFEYYRNNGAKNDANIYGKIEWKPLSPLNVYADMQYRHISYHLNGPTDKFNWGTMDFQNLSVKDKFDFFNPKAGLSWLFSPKHQAYASVGVAHKEPTRNNYTDGHLNIKPRAERLTDFEAGYLFSSESLKLGANLYYMNYKDQLVLTGEMNEIGEALADNVDSSYRLGIELTSALRLENFDWNVAATFSRNKIRNFVETIYEDESQYKQKITTPLGDTNISFSPDIVVNNTFAYSWRGLRASLASHYVGRQYMSNMDCDEHILDAYFVSDLDLSYTFKVKSLKSLTLGITVYNVFNEEYENNGFAGSGFYFDEDDNPVRYNYASYSAQAPANLLVHASVKF